MKILMLSAILGVMLSCSNGKQLSKSVMPITDINWQLVEVKGESVGEGKFKTPYLMLDSKTQKASGNGSCNGFGGNYTLSDQNRLQFSPLMSTKMYCENMNVETSFFDALQKTHHYSVEGETLSLFNEQGELLAKLQSAK